MKKLIIRMVIGCSIAFVACEFAIADPFIVSDPYSLASSPQPTHCAWVLGTDPKFETPVVKNSSTNAVNCRLDAKDFKVGLTTVKASHVVHDPVWGDLESAQSPPLSVTRPGAPATAPAGLKLVPN
ncbi:MAG: hypothetical protein ACU843_15485 [Gammaproteobacteria bacterium]